MRSLDQVAYQDGVSRARSDLKDSYGNPINYDSLEAIDAKKPSKQNDPNQFIIPGYASGILNPHEVPTRSNINADSARRFDDGRIHFIDPLQGSQSPSPSLSVPLGSNPSVLPSQSPIDIPKPNIDLSETPQAPPIDDPLDHVLTPPENDDSGGSPSSSLQTPNFNSEQPYVSQDLIPPQIPSEGPGITIPRPNLDASETPIDNSNGPLNQGLLPPSAAGESNRKVSPPSANPTFSNPNQDGPVIFTEVHFAPKPSNGLLPPKDVSPNDISYQSPDSQQNFQPTVPTTNKLSFGGSPGIIGQAIDKLSGTVGQAVDTVQNKFTGSFGGSSGVLGERGPGASRPNSPVNQIPVVVIQSPFNPPRPSTTQTIASQAPKAAVDKYQGSFGGSPGVLTSNNQNDRVGATPAKPLPTLASPPVPAFESQPSPLADKFSGSFGGASGVLGGSKVPGKKFVFSLKVLLIELMKLQEQITALKPSINFPT